MIDAPVTPFPPLTELLPHAPPMILLDAVVARTHDSITCEVGVRAGAPFCGPRGVDAVVALEYMAQAAGIYAGLATHAGGEPVRPGFLIGCSELDLEVDIVPVNTRLLVEVKQVWGDADLGQFQGKVHDDAQVIATATFNVARAPQDMLKTMPDDTKPMEPS